MTTTAIILLSCATLVLLVLWLAQGRTILRLMNQRDQAVKNSLSDVNKESFMIIRCENLALTQALVEMGLPGDGIEDLRLAAQTMAQNRLDEMKGEES